MCSTLRPAALSRSSTCASTPTRSRWRIVRVTDPSRSGLEVDAVARLARHERVDDLRHAGGDGALRLLGRGPDVVGRDDRGVPAQGRVPRALARARLVREHVQPGAHRARVQGLEQRRLVHHVAPRGVEQDRARPHLAQEARRRPGAGCRRWTGTWRLTMSDVDTSSPSESHIVMSSSSARVSTYGRPTGPGQRLDPDAERRGALRDGEADRAEADDAHRRAEQAAGLAVALLVPVTDAQVAHVVGDPPVDRQQQPHGELGDGGSSCGRGRWRRRRHWWRRRRCRSCWCPLRPGSPKSAGPQPRTPRA